MSIQLPVHNKAKKIVAYTKVSAHQAEDVKRGSLTLCKGYVYIRIDKSKLQLSHYVSGKPPVGYMKDHKDHDILNNTVENLRDVTPAQNSIHKRKQIGCSSQYIGVTKTKTDLWRASIRLCKGRRICRRFATEHEAARWYDNAILFYHKTDTFIPDTNGTLTAEESKNPTQPEVRGKVDNLPKHISKRRNDFRVKMIDADGKMVTSYYKTLKEAEEKTTELEDAISTIKEKRHLALPITRDNKGNAVIVLNQTKAVETQRQVKVDENLWHEINRNSWYWSGYGYPLGTDKKHGNLVALHLFCWELANKGVKRERDLSYEIDHIDHDIFNCMSVNLQKKTRGDNHRDSRKRVGSTSKYVGVSWGKREKKWRATIIINNKQKALGIFDCEEDAAKAYQIAREELR